MTSYGRVATLAAFSVDGEYAANGKTDAMAVSLWWLGCVQRLKMSATQSKLYNVILKDGKTSLSGVQKNHG